MKEKLYLLISNTSRLLSNERISYRLYMILAATSFLVIGIFGIVPSTKNIIFNITLVSDMVKTNTMLSNKLVELKTAEQELSSVGSNIFLLENYLPEDLNIQNYLIDFVFVAGEAEFIVERVSPLNENGGSGSIDLSVVMIGNGDLSKLITLLESLSRVTEIQSLSVVKSGEYDTLTMTVRTFIMEKQ